MACVARSLGPRACSSCSALFFGRHRFSELPLGLLLKLRKRKSEFRIVPLTPEVSMTADVEDDWTPMSDTDLEIALKKLVETQVSGPALIADLGGTSGYTRARSGCGYRKGLRPETASRAGVCSGSEAANDSWVLSLSCG